MKKIICLISLTIMLCLSACSADSADEPQSNLFDWKIYKSVWYIETSTCTFNETEYLYNKTEEYVRQEKAEYESKSTKFYKYKYSFQKLN